jgi:glutamate dehydrogenase
VERFGHLLSEHPLRRELVATINSNMVVNALGPTFVSQLVAERGVRPAQVVRAYRIAREVTGAEAAWEAIEELAGRIEPAAQTKLMTGIDSLVDVVTRWYLTASPDEDLESTIATGREGFERLAAALPQLGNEERRQAREQEAAPLIAAGVPEEIARAYALRPALIHAPNVVAVAATSGQSVEDVGRVFVAVGERVELDRLEAELSSLPVAGRMQRWALQAVREDARAARREIARRALEEAPGVAPDEAVERFLASREEASRRLTAFMRTLSREGSADMAGLALAVRQLGSLAD